MNQAKAQTVIAAVVAAGLDARAHLLADGSWTIRVSSPTFSIDSATVSAFVATQGIVGASQEVLLT